MDSGFGAEDDYNVYTKTLFQGSSANFLYKPKKDLDEEVGGINDEEMKKIFDTSKFRADKEFSGVDDQRKQSASTGTRSKPVEFEKDEENPKSKVDAPSNDDLFGLEGFMTEAKTSAKNALNKIGGSGFMAVGSGDVQGSVEGGSKRGNIAFESSSKKRTDRDSTSSSSNDGKKRK